MLEALRAVTRAVKGRGACKHPDGSAWFFASALPAFTDDLAAHVLDWGCGRETTGALPLPGPAYQEAEASIPGGEKLTVDWTLCQGHGLRSGPSRSGPSRSGPSRSGPSRSGPSRSGPSRGRSPLDETPVRAIRALRYPDAMCAVRLLLSGPR